MVVSQNRAEARTYYSPVYGPGTIMLPLSTKFGEGAIV